MKYTSIKLAALIFLLTMLAMPGHANHVKCKCPNIDARGTGDTSCSASETSGVCSIAFNSFDTELELAAKDSLQNHVRWRKIGYREYSPSGQGDVENSFTRENAIRLSKDTDLFIDQILIYSLVSLAERGIVQDQKVGISAAHRLLQKNADAISKIFVFGERTAKGNGLTVKLGCFEFRTDDFWIMYKASWSESVSNERC